MVRSRALRKRYLLFELRNLILDEEQLKRNLYAEALRFFGEFGLSKVALKLVSFDPKTNLGIIRCERGEADNVLGFLALVSSLDSRPARTIAIKTSGTLKSLGVPYPKKQSQTRSSIQSR